MELKRGLEMGEDDLTSWDLGAIDCPEAHFAPVTRIHQIRSPEQDKSVGGGKVPLLFHETFGHRSECPFFHAVRVLPHLGLLVQSKERRTKVAACELLHALVLHLLGETASVGLEGRKHDQVRKIVTTSRHVNWSLGRRQQTCWIRR